MSSTTIRYRSAEFVANDLPIEVWLLEVVHQIDAGVAPWLDDLKDVWHLQATSGFGFGPSPALDEFLNSDDRRQTLAHYFQKAIEALTRRNGAYTPNDLGQLGVGGEEAIYLLDVPTQMVIDVGKQFLILISGQGGAAD